MTKEIENLIKKSTLRDVQTKMLHRALDGMIISKEIMLEILREVEDEIGKEEA